MFEKEITLLESPEFEDRVDEWDAMYEFLSEPGLRIVSLNNDSVIENVLIHVRGNDVWWRF